MPDPFIIILFFVFFVLPLIERALKKGKPPQQPPQRQPRPPELEQDEPRHSLPPEAGSAERGAAPRGTAGHDPAADMIPDDLWEILTGEKRQRTPAPRRTPAQGAPREDDGWLGGFELEPSPDEPILEGEQVYDTEVGDEIAHGDLAADEDAAAEELRHERERAVHTAERAPRRELGELVIHKPGLPADADHTAVARPVAVPRTRQPALAEDEHYALYSRGAARLAGFGPADRAALRRAIILKEILDPPKGL